MKLIVLSITFLCHISSAEEEIPQFNYKFNGIYEAPIEYFTEYYYQPSLHLEGLKIDPKNIKRENEIKLYMLVKLAQVACKEKFDQDYPLNNNSDLYKYISLISGRKFGDSNPMMMSDIVNIMKNYLSGK